MHLMTFSSLIIPAFTSVLSQNTILWSRNARRIVLKTESSIPLDSLQGLSEMSPKWRMAVISSQRTASSLSLFFLSSINQLKVPQWSSVWQWRGNLSFSDKGSVLVNVRFHPRPAIYEKWWHCVCSLPSYTTECKWLHNKTVHCVHAVNFHPGEVVQTQD